MSEPAAILAVDPAKCSGIALVVPTVGRGDVVRYRLARWGRVKPTTTRAARDVLREALELREGHELEAAIELQYIKSEISKQSIISMVESRMRWQVLAESMGAHVELVQAQTWQTRVLGIRDRRTPRKLRKQAAQHVVRGALGIEATQDEADAICIALWALRDMSVRTERPCRLDQDDVPLEGVRW